MVAINNLPFLFGLFLTIIEGYHEESDYPSNVPIFHVRKDIFTHEPVSTGRFELIGGFPTQPVPKTPYSKVNIRQFRRSLQCLPNEQQFSKFGSLNYMKLIPPTKEIIERVAAWCESDCVSWKQCGDIAKEYKQGNYPKSVERIERMSSGSPYQVKILRISQGKLYLDWPWGRDRLRNPYGSITAPLLYLTNILSDLPDIFFFIGVERPWAPSQFPIPSFSNSPSFTLSDLPFPWYLPLANQIYTYHHIAHTHRNFSHESHLSSSQYGHDIPWDQKLNKCAYYGTLTHNRQIFFHFAATRPDLIDLGWTADYLGTYDWNPLSDNPSLINSDTLQEYANTSRSNSPSGHGYNSNLLPYRLKEGVNFVKKYKYIVVLTGLNGEALSGSMNNLLSQSGAVILLQKSTFLYHYSFHLKPWVHYVPLSYSGDDIIEKIEWLQSHPTLARRIAENGRKFGQSYLRLEDYFCYFVNIFEEIAKRVNNTDALEPFDPLEILSETDRW